MISGLNHITLSVIDIDDSFQFYRETLSMKPLLKWERGAYFLAGDMWVCLSLEPDFKAQKQKGHIAFSSNEKTIDRIQSLIKEGIVLEWTTNTSEGSSVYFLDPSGNQLELHIGDWKTRIEYIKADPYPGEIEFFV